jgi:histidinol-phosphate/aromatic aminotransferase/cobyric acid decarboxylase-like protein
VPGGQHLLLNGASQAFPVLARVFEGARVLIPAPTFGEYPRAFPNAATYLDSGSLDWPDLEATIGSADVVVVVNPNNPTGTVVASGRLVELATRHRQRVFIVDESFIDFSDEPSIVAEVERRGLSNVVVVKSLSKSLGVPGLRLGYVHTSYPAMQKSLWSEIPIWNVNSIAEHFLEVILKHRPTLEESFRQVRLARADFGAKLAELPIVEHVFPSGGNFLLVRLAIDSQWTGSLVDQLMSVHLVHVKDASGKFDDGKGYLRLAVRLPEENDRLCDLLSSMRD